MRFGRLVIRSDKVGSQTVLSQIVQMVAQAQRCFRARIGANDFADEQVLRLAASLDMAANIRWLRPWWRLAAPVAWRWRTRKTLSRTPASACAAG